MKIKSLVTVMVLFFAIAQICFSQSDVISGKPLPKISENITFLILVKMFLSLILQWR